MKSCGLKQPAGFGSTEGHGIPIKGDSAHNVPCSRITGIVLPKRPVAAGFQCTPNVCGCFASVGHGDMMKHAIAIAEISVPAGTILIDLLEKLVCSPVASLSAFG